MAVVQLLGDICLETFAHTHDRWRKLTSWMEPVWCNNYSVGLGMGGPQFKSLFGHEGELGSGTVSEPNLSHRVVVWLLCG